MDDWGDARHRMVVEQLERRGICDTRVVAAMRAVPRHLFVPQELIANAYEDRALPIGNGQTISQPYIVAMMSQALAADVATLSQVLEIGTGSGYQAAILSLIARTVITIERRSDLAASAAQRVDRLGYSNVRVVAADGTLGFPECAPYDGIMVTAGAPHVPAALKAQLREGARLVIPVGSRYHQELTIITRRGSLFREEVREGCVFVPLIGHGGWPEP
jgi:protein-L-isoaspartate(D-aspartate) O-methyltransferase